MVLTNFEMWAADSVPTSEVLLELESTARSRHLNPFNPLHHHHHRHHHHQPNLTHLSSNGYYGFSYINAMHEMEMNNNNNNDNNNVDENHNNNSVTQDFMGNDVNNDNINNNRRVNTVELRCKKRCLISINNSENDCNNETRNHYQSSLSPSAKRCRYDNDDFTAAQHCNDFFSLPFTQIVTQSCYMDTDESSPTIYAHQQLQHLRSAANDETMLNDNNNNNSDIVEKNESLKIQSPHVSNHTHLDELDQQHRHHQHHYPHHDVNHRPQSNQTPQQQLQQHYQGHLHRANRDVNRCMVSHMI